MTAAKASRKTKSKKTTDGPDYEIRLIVPVPLTVGMLRPHVLLPTGLAQKLSDAELEAVALHESAHLQRRDPLVLSLAALIRAALFFHPLVWLVVRRLSALAEHCADDAVLEATGEPAPYATLLARLADDLPGASKRCSPTAPVSGGCRVRRWLEQCSPPSCPRSRRFCSRWAASRTRRPRRRRPKYR
jgi:hypothetical protein